MNETDAIKQIIDIVRERTRGGDKTTIQLGKYDRIAGIVGRIATPVAARKPRQKKGQTETLPGV